MTAALYCRLSREDERKTRESESIQNQRALLAEYAARQGWEIFECYIDDDYSGADRTRPAFNRMLRDAQRGRFSVLLCKSQSRFSRDMEQVEQVLHRLFPEWGVRFIALVDSVDTGVQGGKKSRQINALVNEWYLEDLSESIRAVLDHKRREGQYIGSFAVYGYRKSKENRHRLGIDPGPAAVVRRIFDWYLSGLGKLAIARRLNDEGVPNPTETKRRQGFGYRNGGEKRADGLWSRTTVGRILHDRMYTGDLVQGRRKKVSYKSKRLVSRPPEEWMVTPNAHPPIINREAFETAQTIAAARTRSDGRGHVFPLSGFVFCGLCGAGLSRVVGSGYAYLRCTARAARKAACPGVSIRMDSLEAAILERLRMVLAPYAGPAGQKLLPQAPAPQNGPAQRRRALQQELERRQAALRSLYMDKASGLIDERQFMDFSAFFRTETDEIKKKLAAIPREPERPALPNDIFAPQSLTRPLVTCFLRRVTVWPKAEGGQRVELTWAF